MPPTKNENPNSHSSKPGPSTEVCGADSKCNKFMKLLLGRELGLIEDYHFPETTFRMKVDDYDKVKSHRFGNYNEILHTTYFLRAGRNALIGAWYVQLNNVFTSVVAQLSYDLNKVIVGQATYVESKYTVVDACQLYTNPDHFAFISCDVNKRTGEVHVASPPNIENPQTSTYNYKHPNEKSFWCCNSNPYTRRFAVGCDREICIYAVSGLQEVRLVRDNVYGVSYNRNGSLLYLGCESGEFALYDLRTIDTLIRIKLDDTVLDDVTVLSDENYCLVSGVSGRLMKIDLRTQKKVLDFPSHERRSRKIPVSVNEKFNLVSCTGADDMTRIWCLKSGVLLKSWDSPSTYPARSCFVPNSLRGQIHLIQDNFIHVYSMLR